MNGTQKLDRSRKRATHSVILQTAYTFNQRFAVESFFSWVRQERTTFSSFGDDFTYTQGIGDAILLFKYRLSPIDARYLVQFGVGPKIPLGSSSETNSRGGTESADLQPGSGSWDGIFWGNFSAPFGFRPSMSASVSATYKYTGENNTYLDSTSYQFGKELQVIAGLGDRLNFKQIIIDPSLSLRFRDATQDKFENNEFPNTGGRHLCLALEVLYMKPCAP